MKNRYIINNIVTEYLDSKYAPLSEKLHEFRKQAEEEGVPVILRDTERLLDVLVNITKPRRILEFGTAVGYSACFFAESLKKAGIGEFNIISLESDMDMYEKALDNIDALGFGGNIEVVFGDARQTAGELTGEFDLVFIDAAKSHYRAYFDAALGRSRRGTVIVCDNVLMRGMTASDDYDEGRKHKTNIRNMRKFADYIVFRSDVVTALLPVGDGTAVSYVAH